ncbi:helix-turn-helix domain-containing protein [Dinoroseobacter phage vB_DshS-R4C]|nr:helix-turn-helix domain-containing protein [Dinoroseobacter phage vB_DshS-R4C]
MTAPASLPGPLAVCPAGLGDYLDHIKGQYSLRQIAKATGVHASTVMRRVKVIEDLRDCEDWNLILAYLEDARPDTAPGAWGAPDRGFILDALGLTSAQFRAAWPEAQAVLDLPGGMMILGDAPRAALAAGDTRHTVAKEIALATVAFGLVARSPQSRPRARVYTLSRTAKGDAAFNPGTRAAPRTRTRRVVANALNPYDRPLERIAARHPDLIGPDLLRAGCLFREIYALRDSQYRAEWRRIAEAIPPRSLDILSAVCGRSEGVETVEEALGLPARSGKAVVAYTLEAAAHAAPEVLT